MNNDPWYTRTEFWSTVVTFLMGIFGAKVSQNPIVQNIGATAAGLAPIVYSWGRSNVKASQAASALSAVGNALAPAKPS